MPTDVVIVVVTYNSAEVIGGLLASLPAALGDLRYHVTVVDNGSHDRTVEVLAASPWVHRVVRSTNVGYAAGVNSGVAASPAAPAIVILNPDARLEPLSVPPMVARLGVNRVGVVAPAVTDPDGSVSRSLRRTPSLGRATGLGFTGWAVVSEYVDQEWAYRHAHPVEWALGAALAVDRTCYQDLNGWDESYFLYSEETDFCLRARDAGWRVMFEPSSRVMHIGGGSGRSDRTHVMQIVNRVRLYRRRHGALAGWAYYALTVISECSWILRGHRTSRASVAALLFPGRRPEELAARHRVPT